MTGNITKIRRKRLFVDSKVQGSLVRQLIIHWSLACFLIFLYLFSLQAFSNGFEMTFQANLAAMWQQYGILALVLGVISPVFIYDSMKLSNRFVGPMKSFRAAMTRVAAGEDVGELNFRQDDFWRELARDFNSITAELAEARKANQAGQAADAVDVEQAETDTASS